MDETGKKNHKMDMCSGPILKKMLIFAIPLMFSSIIQLLFNAADIVVVGRFSGDNSLSAVGSNTALIHLLINFFVGLSVGANVLAARYFGSKQMQDLNTTVHTAIKLAVISGLILNVAGVLLARQLLNMMQTPSEFIDLATVYLRIYFFSMIPTMIYNFGSAILRAVGDTKRPLYYLVTAGIINIMLNLIFVIVFKMDVAGVGLATVISESISAFLIINCLAHESDEIRLQWSRFRIDIDKFKDIIKIGLPAGIQGTIFAISNVVIQSSINSFGNITVAGSAAAANIEGFVYFAMNAFYQAVMSFTSQNAGAGRYDRINKILITGLMCTAVTGFVLGNGSYIFGDKLLGIYTKNPDTIAAGLKRMSIIACTHAIGGMMDVVVGALRGLGYSIVPMFVSLIGVCGLRLVWIATVFQMEQFHNISMVYISYPITWTITLLAHLVSYIIVRRKLPKKKKI